MRKIVIKNFVHDGEVLLTEKGHHQNYADIIVPLLQRPKNPQAGVDIVEMRLVMPIIDKFEAVPEQLEIDEEYTVLLEENEWTEVKERVSTGPYPAATRQVLQMVDEIENAEQVDVKEG